MNFMLKRKIRKVGSSIVLTIPAHIAEAYDIKCGEYIEIFPQKDNSLLLKKEKKDI